MRRDRVRGGLAQLHDDSTAAIGDDGGGNDDDDDDDYVERAKCSRGERKESRDLESVRSCSPARPAASGVPRAKILLDVKVIASTVCVFYDLNYRCHLCARIRKPVPGPA